MKTRFRFALAASILSIVAPSAAFAQMVEPMKFTTSFPFSVGRTNFGPGNYTARPMDDNPSVVCIQAERGGPAAIVIGVPEVPRKEPPTSEVTFVREGTRLVLKSLWDNSGSEGLDIMPAVAPTLAN